MKYNPALDGLRALAAFGVILYHAGVPYSHVGMLGVDVFFVLSGYLITAILVQQHASGTFSLTGFYLRRARRLYPALIAAVALYLLAVTFWWNPWPEVSHWEDSAIALAYLSDYAIFWDRPVILRHTWTLAVEEHFYLIWPLVVARLVRLPREQTVKWLLFLIFAATLWRGWSLTHLGFSRTMRFDSHSDALLIGALLAFVPLDAVRWKPLALICGALALGALAADFKGWSMTLVALASMGLVAQCVCTPPALLSHPWLAYAGRISYGLYLYHYLVVRYLRVLDVHWLPKVAITLAVTFAIAALSYHTIEAWLRLDRTYRPARLTAQSP